MNIFPSFVVDKRRFYTKNATHLFVIVPNNSNTKSLSVNRNSLQILLISICLGITLGIALTPILEGDCDVTENSLVFNSPPLENQNAEDSNQLSVGSENDVSQRSKMLRPRFYTSELGFRKKLVAGIILTKYKDYENLIALNRTLSTYVNQLLFFVVGHEAAQEAKNLGIPGVVTLTSRRNDSSSDPGIRGSSIDAQKYNLIALRAIKYLGDKFSNSYDYFFFGFDTYYVNGHVLSDAVKKISISQDVFWGFPDDSGVCNLENGLVFSRSVIRRLSTRLDRCLSSVTLKEGNNGVMKNCFQYALGSFACSKSIQGHVFNSITPEEMDKHVGAAVCIGPLSSAISIYEIHLHVSQGKAENIDEKISNLSTIIDKIVPRMPPQYQKHTWPPGIAVAHISESRFDLLIWKFFTPTHLYPNNELSTEKTLDGVDLLDIESVIRNSEQYLAKLHNTTQQHSFSFQYGYRRFDETRGMEYILDFQDSIGQISRVECVRPLSKVEMVPMPFVTEGRRVTIVIPVTLDSYTETDSFLINYLNSANTGNSVLVIAIVLKDNSLSSEESKKLQSLKRMIASHNSNLQSSEGIDSMKIGHVVVNLKHYKVSHYVFAVFDMLSNRILNTNALVLVLDLFVEIQDEFLNRVRMNTVLNFQVFSPISFVEYDPQISGHSLDNQQLQVHKSTGYFDSESFNFISFFVGDYVTARKSFNAAKSKKSLTQSISGVEMLSRLFLKGSQLHFLRAPEPTLQVRFDKNIYLNCSQPNQCLKRKFASKVDLAKYVLSL